LPSYKKFIILIYVKIGLVILSRKLSKKIKKYRNHKFHHWQMKLLKVVIMITSAILPEETLIKEKDMTLTRQAGYYRW